MNDKPGYFDRIFIRKIKGQWVNVGHDPNPPDPERAKTDPAPQDRKINPQATTTRREDGSFFVQNILRVGGHTTIQLSTDCPYCKHTLVVIANAPGDMPKFAKDEACRLALLHHLRTDHLTKHTSNKTTSL
jgi:hypothetical protein